MGLIHQTSVDVWMRPQRLQEASITTTGQLLIVTIASPLHELLKTPTALVSTIHALPAIQEGEGRPIQESKGRGGEGTFCGAGAAIYSILIPQQLEVPRLQAIGSVP